MATVVSNVILQHGSLDAGLLTPASDMVGFLASYSVVLLAGGLYAFRSTNNDILSDLNVVAHVLECHQELELPVITLELIGPC